MDTLRDNGQKYDTLLAAATSKTSLDAGRLRALNQLLVRTERVLTRPEGLPDRPWYKHQIYAPGVYTGYGAKTLPGIREAVEAKKWTLAQRETGIVEECLAEMNQVVTQAIDELSGL